MLYMFGEFKHITMKCLLLKLFLIDFILNKKILCLNIT